MRAALQGREWDAVFDVSGFIMVAMGSNMQDMVDLLDGQVGAYVFTSSIMGVCAIGRVPLGRDLPHRRRGPEHLRRLQKRWSRSCCSRSMRVPGFPASIVRPASIYGPDNNIYDMEMAYFLRLMRGLPIIVPHEGLVTGSYGHGRRSVSDHGRHGGQRERAR